MNMRHFGKIVLTPFLLLALSAGAAYDVREINLGASEKDIRRALPSAHCKALEWQSRAADRRCDDSRVEFGGVEVRVTFYLRKDAVEAFDVRFHARDLERLVAFLKTRYGEPQSEGRDSIKRERGKAREIYRALWESPKERAVLTAQLDKRVGSMLVSRGSFDEEIYKVR
jgi:hypothetical protein